MAIIRKLSMDSSIKREGDLINENVQLHQKVANLERLRIDNTSFRKSLRKQENEFQTLLDSVPTAIWCIDNKGQVSLVNRAGVSFLDMAKEDVVGRYIDQLSPFGKTSNLMADLIEIINFGKSKMGIVEKYTLPSGKERWVQSDKIPQEKVEILSE
jgi:PAS domain S-box-containing protein